MRFTKLLKNSFRSSFEIPDVHYKLGNLSIKSSTSKRSCEFQSEFRWEVAKFVASREVCVIRCSSFDNMATNDLRKVKKNSQPSKAYFVLFTPKLKCKLFERYRGTPHYRRMARLASGLQWKC